MLSLKSDGFYVASKHAPAQQTGGDLYRNFPLQLLFIIHHSHLDDSRFRRREVIFASRLPD